MLALAGPIGAVGLAFAAARLLKNEAVAMRAILVGWFALGIFVLLAANQAFVRKERGRWLAASAVLLMLAIVLGGVSSP